MESKHIPLLDNPFAVHVDDNEVSEYRLHDIVDFVDVTV